VLTDEEIAGEHDVGPVSGGRCAFARGKPRTRATARSTQPESRVVDVLAPPCFTLAPVDQDILDEARAGVRTLVVQHARDQLATGAVLAADHDRIITVGVGVELVATARIAALSVTRKSLASRRPLGTQAA